MKFTISSSKLFAELQVVSRALPNKHTIKILESILLDLHETTLDIIASNGDLLVSTSISVDSSDNDNGKICLNASLLLDSLKELADQPVTFDIDKTAFSVTMSSQTGVYTCVGDDGEQYPEIGLLKEDDVEYSQPKTLIIPSMVLFKAIASTYICTRNDEYVDVVSGIYFNKEEDRLSVVGTDTHRMAQYTCYNIQNSDLGSFLLSRKVAKVIQGMLTDNSGDVTIHYQGHRADFDFSNRHVSSSLLQTPYPDYKSVIIEGGKEMVIDRIMLLNACKRVAVFSDQSTSLLRFTLNGDNELHLFSQDVNFATSAQETLSCSYVDEPIEIGLKSSALVEMLDSLQTSEITFKLIDEVKVIQILPSENDEGCEFIMLIMPISLKN